MVTIPFNNPVLPPKPLDALAPPQGGNYDIVSPAPLSIETDFQGALDVESFAEQHANVADQYVQALVALAGMIVPPTINPDFPTNTNPPALSVPTPPVVEPTVWVPPPVPLPFNQTLSVNDLFPMFTAAPPSLIFPNAPIPPNLVVPGNPTVDLNFTYPTVEVNLPNVPALLTIDSFTFNGVTLPTLDAKAPVLTAVAPSPTIYIPNAPYTDALLATLTSTLRQRLDIGNTGTNTGLPPAIEENIWNRGRERELRAQADAIAALDRMQDMGYAYPPGSFSDAVIKVQTDTMYTIAGQSRDVATEQAKLEQENIKMALDLSVQIESKLLDYNDHIEERRFQTCKYMTDASVEIYNAQVNAFSQMVNVYRAAIDIYNAQIQGAKIAVDIYTAELQAEKIKVDMNTALIEQYKVQVDAALASIQIFQAEVDIIKTQAEIESLKVQIFGEEVKAYTAQINAYQANVEAYKALLSAEEVKENVYATQATVFKTQVEAITEEINANIEVFKAQLAAKTEEYDAYKALVEGQTAQVQAIAAQNTATADVYRAVVSGTSAYNDALVKEWQAAMEIAEQITQIGVSAANMNVQAYLTSKQIVTEAAKVAAQVESQIAAAGISSVTWATHRARQDNVSFGQSKSVGSNTNFNNTNEVINSTSDSAQNSASNVSEFSNATNSNVNTNISEVE